MLSPLSIRYLGPSSPTNSVSPENVSKSAKLAVIEASSTLASRPPGGLLQGDVIRR
jgi:hypothetical protein